MNQGAKMAEQMRRAEEKRREHQAEMRERQAERNPNSMRPYVIAKGQTYVINGYSVSITKGQKALSLAIDVSGHYGESKTD